MKDDFVGGNENMNKGMTQRVQGTPPNVAETYRQDLGHRVPHFVILTFSCWPEVPWMDLKQKCKMGKLKILHGLNAEDISGYYVDSKFQENKTGGSSKATISKK